MMNFMYVIVVVYRQICMQNAERIEQITADGKLGCKARLVNMGTERKRAALCVPWCKTAALFLQKTHCRFCISQRSGPVKAAVKHD